MAIKPVRRGRTGKPSPIPTPEEIQQRAAEVRAGWSKAERLKRAGLSAEPWTPPTITETVGLGDPAASGD